MVTEKYFVFNVVGMRHTPTKAHLMSLYDTKKRCWGYTGLNNKFIKIDVRLQIKPHVMDKNCVELVLGDFCLLGYVSRTHNVGVAHALEAFDEHNIDYMLMLDGYRSDHVAQLSLHYLQEYC